MYGVYGLVNVIIGHYIKNKTSLNMFSLPPDENLLYFAVCLLIVSCLFTFSKQAAT